MELIRGKDGFLYRIDPTESFDMPYFAINKSCYCRIGKNL
jgi:hypothetical protein